MLAKLDGVPLMDEFEERWSECALPCIHRSLFVVEARYFILRLFRHAAKATLADFEATSCRVKKRPMRGMPFVNR